MIIEIASLISIFIYVSFWEYSQIMYKLHPEMPYKEAFNIFSVLQWIVIGAALVHMFYWVMGFLALLFTATILQYFTHFTLGFIYSKIFKDPMVPLAIFGVLFWINILITVALFLF